jgi:putative alpha-1,2-mannosidase
MGGNDDAGQMSAWLVLSSLGFYQVCPGCGGRSEYVFGLPLFAHVEVLLPSPPESSVECVASSGFCSADSTAVRTLVMTTVRLNNAKTDKYVQLVTWNGCAYDCAFFPHAMIAAGGTLVAYLGPVPNKSWGGDGRKCMDTYLYPGDKDDITDGTKAALC